MFCGWAEFSKAPSNAGLPTAFGARFTKSLEQLEILALFPVKLQLLAYFFNAFKTYCK